MPCNLMEAIIYEDTEVAGVPIKGQLWTQLWHQDRPSKFLTFLASLLWTDDELKKKCVKKMSGQNYEALSPEKVESCQKLYNEYCRTINFDLKYYNVNMD